MYEFRKNHESQRSKKRLGEWELSLLSSSVHVELIVEAERSTNQPRGDGIKGRQGDGISLRRKKAIAMSSNALLHEQS